MDGTLGGHRVIWTLWRTALLDCTPWYESPGEAVEAAWTALGGKLAQSVPLTIAWMIEPGNALRAAMGQESLNRLVRRLEAESRRRPTVRISRLPANGVDRNHDWTLSYVFFVTQENLLRGV